MFSSSISQMKPNLFTTAIFALVLLSGLWGIADEIDSELGELPPLPNLNLGDPDTKPTRAEVKMRTRIVQLERAQEEQIRKAEEEKSGVVQEKRPSGGIGVPTKKPVISQQITVSNSLPANEDGITASGSRLKPFGEEDAWAAMAEPTPEEALVNLPPLPDLRTPDQVTRSERTRNLLVAKSEERKAVSDALQEQKELEQRVTVDRPMRDPSTALVQVESMRQQGVDYREGWMGDESDGLGPLLTPFGDARYWGEGMNELSSDEEPLAELPPLPDLRTPDQVTRKEQNRKLLVSKAEERRNGTEAARELREMNGMTVVNVPLDPSTAIHQVESRRGTGAEGIPEKLNQSPLTPFNEYSTYYLGGAQTGGGGFSAHPQEGSYGGGMLGEEAFSSTGPMLDPYGQDQFWRGEKQDDGSEELMIDLPPLPDLRTPDQVTQKERKWGLLAAKFEERKSDLEAAREERELNGGATVYASDPSSAISLVESRRGVEQGAQVGPETMGRSVLTPFNEDSAYYHSGSASRGSASSVSPQEGSYGGGVLGEDAFRSTGPMLDPFGEGQVWTGEMQRDGSEDLLVELPPLPDLRTPDQVTRKERTRNILVSKADLRKSENDAERELREIRERAVVSGPTMDPSSALIQVESQRGSGSGYAGNQAAPETTNQTALKPFNENSAYYGDDQFIHEGERKVDGSEPPKFFFWKRSTKDN